MYCGTPCSDNVLVLCTTDSILQYVCMYVFIKLHLTAIRPSSESFYATRIDPPKGESMILVCMYVCIVEIVIDSVSEDVLVLCTTLYCRNASAALDMFCVQSLLLYTTVVLYSYGRPNLFRFFYVRAYIHYNPLHTNSSDE